MSRPLLAGVSLILLACWTLAGCASSNRDALEAEYRDLERQQIDAQKAQRQERKRELAENQADEIAAEPSNEAEEARNRQFAAAAESASRKADLEAAAINDFSSSASPETATVYPSTWNAIQFPHPINGKMGCALVTKPVTVVGEQLETNIQLILTGDSIYIRSDAILDPAAPETGFSIDAGIPIRFDGLANEVTLVVNESFSRLMTQLEQGSFLSVTFTYDLQSQSSDVHVVDYELDDFSLNLSKYKTCLEAGGPESE